MLDSALLLTNFMYGCHSASVKGTGNVACPVGLLGRTTETWSRGKLRLPVALCVAPVLGAVRGRLSFAGQVVCFVFFFKHNCFVF